MEYKATAKYLRTAPRKLRLVADAIRDLTPENAILYLGKVNKQAAKPLKNVLESALANAKAKNINFSKLEFAKIEVMEGPVMKRWRAVSRGTAHAYIKRMTHVRIVLKEKLDSGKKLPKTGGKKWTKKLIRKDLD